LKLKIKEMYFKAIRNGSKTLDYRDAHITFVCEETGEELRKEVSHAEVVDRPPELYPGLLEDDKIIKFTLR